MRILLVIFLVIVYIFGGCPDWMSYDSTSMMMKALQYHFFHANIFHLLVNCTALCTLFSPRRKDNAVVFAMSYVIAVAVYPLASVPIVGVSNIIYAGIGMRTPSLNSKWWKSAPTITFLIITILMLFFKQFAGTTHVASFVLGVCIAIIRRQWIKR